MDIKPTRRPPRNIITILDMKDIRVTEVTDIFGEMHWNVTVGSSTRQYLSREDAEFDLSVLLSRIEGTPNIVLFDRN